MAHKSPPSELGAISLFGWEIVIALVLCLGSLFIWGQRRLSTVQADNLVISGDPAQRNAPGAKPESGPPTTVWNQVGIEATQKEMGIATPTGRGIHAMHVEGLAGDYLPNVNDPVFLGLKLNPRSGPSKANGHTEWTSKTIYGKNGFAPGIPEVEFLTSEHWMNAGCLNTFAPTPAAPDPHGARISNHSWIGMGTGSHTEQILRRVDYLVDAFNHIAVVGVNNGADTSVPPLLGSAYNVIAVGNLNEQSSKGYTQVEIAGRCKPDVVATTGLVSYCTPVVTSVCARLLEAADRRTDAPQAREAEVIRALLMAGAEKPPKWKPEPGKPLDEHLGAGLVRLDQSLQILADGPCNPGAAPPRSWSHQNVPAKGRNIYSFTLLQASGEASLIAAWNRRIDGRVVEDFLTHQTRWFDMPRLADFDLALQRMEDDNSWTTIAASASLIDNVEHIYLPRLPAGKYRILVTRRDDLSEPYDMAVAWRIEPAPGAIASPAAVPAAPAISTLPAPAPVKTAAP